jgi:hypothetical protein
MASTHGRVSGGAPAGRQQEVARHDAVGSQQEGTARGIAARGTARVNTAQGEHAPSRWRAAP